MTATIARVNGLTLPAASPWRREPRRPRHLQPPDFAERFDFTTLFYDAFAVGSRVCLAGPPLFNLRHLLASSSWAIDGKPLDTQQVVLGDVDRTQRSWLDLPRSGSAQVLQLKCGTLYLETPVSGDGVGLFAGRNVLLTLSKNNSPSWIRDWIVFHRDHHAIDAVLLYDNGSYDYTIEALRAALERIDGVSVVLVPWNYRYGPLGGPDDADRVLPWDSDFCQYGMLEHAKLRFLRDANLVVNADVDELLLGRGGEAIGGLMDRQRLDFCRYSGRWIENIRITGAVGTPRHADFGLVLPTRAPCEAKWSLRPQQVPLDRAQWRVHLVSGLPMEICPDITFRHFDGITTGWRRPREPSITDTSELHIDTDLRQAMTRSFGEAATFPMPAR